MQSARGWRSCPTGSSAQLDHRIAMSFAIAGLAARAPVTIDDMSPIATSFPTFEHVLQAIGASRLYPAVPA